MSNLYIFATLLVAFLTLLSLRKLLYRGSSTRHLPPGPKGLPFIGSLLDLPRTQEWETYSQWSDKWGERLYHIVSIPAALANSCLSRRRNVRHRPWSADRHLRIIGSYF